jgi:hypothetical protein
MNRGRIRRWVPKRRVRSRARGGGDVRQRRREQQAVTEWVEVNGARIERSFLEENVAEARLYSWEPTRFRTVGGHGHCIVCGVSVYRDDSCFRSEGGWLCPYCFTTFVNRAAR